MRKLSMVGLVCACLGLMIPTAGATSDCDTVHGTLNGFLTGPASTAGTIDIDGDGVDDGSFTSVITSAPKNTGMSGVLILTSAHQFSLDDGRTFTTSDHLRAIPTKEPGVYSITSNLDLVSGASGNLVGHGTINFITGAIDMPKVNGVICT